MESRVERRADELVPDVDIGETSETWIKPKKKRQNGRLDFKALQAHYGGEGNKSVRIKEAEVLRNTLSYKNERTMSFEKFLTNMQAMFTGFEDNNEVLTNSQKVRLLFQKVQCSTLTQVKSALQVQSNLDIEGDTVTYDFIANSLAAEAAAMPDYVPNRQASGVESKRVGFKGPTAQSLWSIIRIGVPFPRLRRATSMRSARCWVSCPKVTRLDASRALSSPRRRMFIQ